MQRKVPAHGHLALSTVPSPWTGYFGVTAASTSWKVALSTSPASSRTFRWSRTVWLAWRACRWMRSFWVAARTSPMVAKIFPCEARRRLAAWHRRRGWRPGKEATMLTQTIDIRTVEDLVTGAVTAPSMHNAQPWAFRFVRGSGLLQLRRDPARAMPVTDLGHRAQHLSCGAALFNLRVAAAHAGWEPQVDPLPAPDEPELLADIRFRPSDADPDHIAALFRTSGGGARAGHRAELPLPHDADDHFELSVQADGDHWGSSPRPRCGVTEQS